MSKRIVIFTDDPGWHGARLRAAFGARGYEAIYASLTECRIDLAGSRWGVVIPGFDAALPAGVFVRGVPGGTLEQVILRLDILHVLKELDVPVYNDGRAIERSVDKAMTSFLLRRAGIPTPPTWIVESEHGARAHVIRETAAGRELVIKPLFGSQGDGLKRIADVSELPPAQEYDNVHYLQRFIDTGEGTWHDWRVFVIAGKAVASMIRRGKIWVNNVAQGATCEYAEIDESMGSMAESAATALGMDYAGVDIIRGQDGNPMVIEVNGIPAWKGLQSVCHVDIAQLMVDDFLSRRLQRQPLEAVAP